MKNKKKSAKEASVSKPENSASVPDSARNVDDKIWKDARFAHLVSDPRFKNITKETRSIKIDKRFQSMFKDDKFSVNYTVDKYGRPSKKSSGSDLKKYYDLSSENEDDEQAKEKEAISKDDETAALEELQAQLESDDEEIPKTLKEKLKDLTVDYARGESALWSDEDSSDDESSDEDEEKELYVEHVWGALDMDAPRTEESTRRMALCNMDWDRMRAADILVLCSSFLPPGGAIISVKIYPSEYGKERMAEEELRGPQELTEKTIESESEDLSDDDDDDEDALAYDSDPDAAKDEDEAEEGADYHMEKLRQYQLNRLRYFYAVIECNSVFAADKIYAECDGMEYESTATKFDLRFVPDDMTFDDEPKDVCTEMPDTSKYMPRLFTTTALQQAKVELTWDENDLDRKELNDKLMAGKLNEVADQELRKYVAYSSDEADEVAEEDAKVVVKKKKNGKKKSTQSDEDSADETESKPAKKTDALSKYKALLAEINEQEAIKKNNRIEMEYSWGIGSKGGNPFKDDKDTDTAVKPTKKDPEKTHFDKIVELKKEKKKARKEEQKIKRKKYRKGAANPDDSGSEIGERNSDDDEDVPDGVDMNDPYFAEEFANGEFEAPKVKKKTAKSSNKKRFGGEPNSEDERQKAELALLLDDGEDGDKRAHFSLKKIQDGENESKAKRKRKSVLRRSKKQNQAEKTMLQEDDFTVNTEDNRFAAIYSSHLFSIDPTNPNYKKTKGMEALIGEKLKRNPVADGEIAGGSENRLADGPAAKKAKRDVATSILVKSIKRKVAQQ